MACVAPVLTLLHFKECRNDGALRVIDLDPVGNTVSTPALSNNFLLVVSFSSHITLASATLFDKYRGIRLAFLKWIGMRALCLIQ